MYTMQEAGGTGNFLIAFPDFNSSNPALNYQIIDRVSTFYEICRSVPNPLAMMSTFIANKISDKPEAHFKLIYWPETIIEMKMGGCHDFSIFMREYFQQKMMDYKFVYIMYASVTHQNIPYGHVFPIFKSDKDGNWYIWNYFAKGIGDVHGPFETPNDAAKAACEYFLVVFKSLMLSRDPHSTIAEYNIAEYMIADPADLSIIDYVRKEKGLFASQDDFISKPCSLRHKMTMLIEDIRAKLNKYEIEHSRGRLGTLGPEFPRFMPVFKSYNALQFIKSHLLDFNKVRKEARRFMIK